MDFKQSKGPLNLPKNNATIENTISTTITLTLLCLQSDLDKVNRYSQDQLSSSSHTPSSEHLGVGGAVALVVDSSQCGAVDSKEQGVDDSYGQDGVGQTSH